MYIFVQAYPSELNHYAMSYVHSRNLIYKEYGLNFKVVSFSAKESYEIDGIQVLTEEIFLKELKDLSTVKIISHAPNLKNHVRLFQKIKDKISSLIIVLHGHEVLDVNKYYPKDYGYIKTSFKKKTVQYIYNKFKIIAMRNFLKKWDKTGKITIFYVSDWMKSAAKESLSINIDCPQFVINNNINPEFLTKEYNQKPDKKANFITIRPLDGSKYGIDLVYNLAKNNPNLTFHIYGKGDFFEHNEILSNMVHYPKFIKPNEIAELLNYYDCALMPTRLDAQGVMMCEMASYGIPLVTTNLEVCDEMLSSFTNCVLLPEENFSKKFNIELLKASKVKNDRFSIENTVLKEIQIIKGEV